MGSMAVDSQSRREVAEALETVECDVSTYESCPGRFVFVEEGNPDGWLSTDVTVELRR